MKSNEKLMDDRALFRVLKALSDKQRFQMLEVIARAGELSCGQVVERFHLSQPTISHHLKILHDAGVLLVRRDAQHAFISVDRKLVGSALGMIPVRLKKPAKVRKRRTKRSV